MVLTLGYYGLLIAAWIGAWVVHGTMSLSEQATLADTVYWTCAKMLIWLLPIFAIISVRKQRSITAYLCLKDARNGVAIGVVCGVAFAALTFLRDVFTRRFGLPAGDPGLLNALLIAPLFEEIVFRGFLLRLLQDADLGFWAADVVTATLFLGIHLPGWYFMGSPNLWNGAAMLGIFLVGMVAGYAKQRSGSLWGAIVFHFVNNLYSAFVR
jgi:membrane protease YdiL (CAAX protease family)